MVLRDDALAQSRGIMGSLESSGASVQNNRGRLRQRFDLIRKLGQGTYGKVQLGIDKETGQEVAIKTIKKSKIETEADLIRIQREIQIMSSVRHPNIIHIYEVFENRDKMVLVMEYAAGGELYDYLNERKTLQDEEAKRLFRQIASATYYCHKHNICHRDLKLENILLDEKWNAKIADFGLSNVFDDSHLLKTFCGSPLYASPEIVRGTPYYGPEVDCWSLGVLLYTLVYGAMPFDGSNFKRLVKQISHGDYYEPSKKSEASNLIRCMLTVDPLRRADIKQICKHEWLNGGGFKEDLIQVAEGLALKTPVRLDLLLSLVPGERVGEVVVAGGKQGEEVGVKGENKEVAGRKKKRDSTPNSSEAPKKEARLSAVAGTAPMATGSTTATTAPMTTTPPTPTPAAADKQEKRKQLVKKKSKSSPLLELIPDVEEEKGDEDTLSEISEIQSMAVEEEPKQHQKKEEEEEKVEEKSTEEKSNKSKEKVKSVCGERKEVEKSQEHHQVEVERRVMTKSPVKPVQEVNEPNKRKIKEKCEEKNNSTREEQVSDESKNVVEHTNTKRKEEVGQEKSKTTEDVLKCSDGVATKLVKKKVTKPSPRAKESVLTGAAGVGKEDEEKVRTDSLQNGEVRQTTTAEEKTKEEKVDSPPTHEPNTATPPPTGAVKLRSDSTTTTGETSPTTTPTPPTTTTTKVERRNSKIISQKTAELIQNLEAKSSTNEKTKKLFPTIMKVSDVKSRFESPPPVQKPVVLKSVKSRTKEGIEPSQAEKSKPTAEEKPDDAPLQKKVEKVKSPSPVLETTTTSGAAGGPPATKTDFTTPVQQTPAETMTKPRLKDKLDEELKQKPQLKLVIKPVVQQQEEVSATTKGGQQHQTTPGQQPPAKATGQQPPATTPGQQQPPATTPGQQPPPATTPGQQPPPTTPGQQPPSSSIIKEAAAKRIGSVIQRIVSSESVPATPLSPPPTTTPFRTEIQKFIQASPPQQQRTEVKFPASKSTSKSERIIPIQILGDPSPLNSTPSINSSTTSITTGGGSTPRTFPPPPPPPLSRYDSLISSTSSLLSRQNSSDSESMSMSSFHPQTNNVDLKKSPREFIIPIKIEGGGVTARRDLNSEDSQDGFRLDGSRLRSGRFSTPTAVPSHSRSKSQGDETSTPTTPSSSSTGFKRYRRPKSTALFSGNLEKSDSFSSNEGEDDEDTFEVLTAESLFSSLLDRVRNLTRRLNREESSSGWESPSFHPFQRELGGMGRSPSSTSQNYIATASTPSSRRSYSREPSLTVTITTGGAGPSSQSSWRRSLSRDVSGESDISLMSESGKVKSSFDSDSLKSPVVTRRPPLLLSRRPPIASSIPEAGEYPTTAMGYNTGGTLRRPLLNYRRTMSNNDYSSSTLPSCTMRRSTPRTCYERSTPSTDYSSNNSNSIPDPSTRYSNSNYKRYSTPEPSLTTGVNDLVSTADTTPIQQKMNNYKSYYESLQEERQQRQQATKQKTTGEGYNNEVGPVTIATTATGGQCPTKMTREEGGHCPPNPTPPTAATGGHCSAVTTTPTAATGGHCPAVTTTPTAATGGHCPAVTTTPTAATGGHCPPNPTPTLKIKREIVEEGHCPHPTTTPLFNRLPSPSPRGRPLSIPHFPTTEAQSNTRVESLPPKSPPPPVPTTTTASTSFVRRAAERLTSPPPTNSNADHRNFLKRDARAGSVDKISRLLEGRSAGEDGQIMKSRVLKSPPPETPPMGSPPPAQSPPPPKPLSKSKTTTTNKFFQSIGERWEKFTSKESGDKIVQPEERTTTFNESVLLQRAVSPTNSAEQGSVQQKCGGGVSSILGRLRRVGDRQQSQDKRPQSFYAGARSDSVLTLLPSQVGKKTAPLQKGESKVSVKETSPHTGEKPGNNTTTHTGEKPGNNTTTHTGEKPGNNTTTHTGEKRDNNASNTTTHTGEKRTSNTDTHTGEKPVDNSNSPTSSTTHTSENPINNTTTHTGEKLVTPANTPETNSITMTTASMQPLSVSVEPCRGRSPVSPNTLDAGESVGDRILRKSFYTRFQSPSTTSDQSLTTIRRAASSSSSRQPTSKFENSSSTPPLLINKYSPNPPLFNELHQEKNNRHSNYDRTVTSKLSKLLREIDEQTTTTGRAVKNED